MATEFKTLEFPNTPEGQRDKTVTLQKAYEDGWEVVSENIKEGEFRGGRACCFFLIFAPCAFLAGTTDGTIIVTLKREQDKSPRNEASVQSAVALPQPQPQSQPQPIIASQAQPQPITANVSYIKEVYEPIIGVETDALITRGGLFLEDGNFAQADRYFEQALNQSPTNSDAYLEKMMATRKFHSTDELIKSPQPFYDDSFFQKALRFADNETKARLEGYVQARLDAIKQAEMEQRYAAAVRALNSATKSSSFQFAAGLFDTLGDYNDSKALAEEARIKQAAKEREEEEARDAARKAELERRYETALSILNSATTSYDFQRAAELFDDLGDYNDAKTRAEEARAKQAEAQEAERKAELERRYETALNVLNGAASSYDFKRAAGLFDDLGDYNDAKARAEEARAKQAVTENEEAQAAAKRQKIIWSLIVAAVVAGTGLLIYNSHLEQERKRAEAEETYVSAQAAVEAGKLDSALELYRKAAELGHKEAKNEIAPLEKRVEQEAERIRKEKEEEERRIQQEREEKARREQQEREEAEKRAADAYQKAVLSLDAGEYAEALKGFRELAFNGHAPSQDKIGWMYQNGWGVRKDYAQARIWYQKAAAQGNAYAQTSLGFLYHKGLGIPQDFDEALKWYRKAAAQGVQKAKDGITEISNIKNANTEKKRHRLPAFGYINGDKVNVRAEPNLYSYVKKQLNAGHPVGISRRSSDNEWYYVRTVSGTEGWVFENYVAFNREDSTVIHNRASHLLLIQKDKSYDVYLDKNSIDYNSGLVHFTTIWYPTELTKQHVATDQNFNLIPGKELGAFILNYRVDMNDDTYIHLRTLNLYDDGNVARDYVKPQSEYRWETPKKGSRIETLIRILHQLLK